MERILRRLDGKRVLLIAPRFFGYEIDIKNEIERRGASVDWLQDRPFDAPLMMALTKISPTLVTESINNLYQNKLYEFGATHYDYIFVVNGQTLSKKMLQFLRSNFPTSKTILYMWDSIKNRRSVVGNLNLFDETYTFDPQGYRDYGMKMRPLFFSKGFENPICQDHEYDLSFVGTAHCDRYSVIKKLSKNLNPSLSTFWYLFLQAPWVFYGYRLVKVSMRGAQLNEFNFKPLDKTKVESIFSTSKAILDIEHPKQTGLTMRTFEAMGAQKKLVTTNSLISNYDFFNVDNVCILDRTNPIVPQEFFEKPFRPLPKNVYQRYTIEGWLDEIMGLNH